MHLCLYLIMSRASMHAGVLRFSSEAFTLWMHLAASTGTDPLTCTTRRYHTLSKLGTACLPGWHGSCPSCFLSSQCVLSAHSVPSCIPTCKTPDRLHECPFLL